MFKSKEILKELKQQNELLSRIVRKLDTLIFMGKNKKGGNE